eukprot:gene1088-3132_t
MDQIKHASGQDWQRRLAGRAVLKQTIGNDAANHVQERRG